MGKCDGINGLDEVCIGLTKNDRYPMNEHSYRPKLRPCMPYKPYDNILFDHIDRYVFFLVFFVLILIVFSYLKRVQLLVSSYSAVVSGSEAQRKIRL